MVEQVASEGITEGMKDEQEAEEADDTPAPAPQRTVDTTHDRLCRSTIARGVA
jgi:hypothetical protein